mmetsp:Transcript_135362/g.239467  ORF Transcript_135362/g.239467 Transcript_135362/m.239467 type:complete len:208 (-) Transcript_135362:71-694(-)
MGDRGFSPRRRASRYSPSRSDSRGPSPPRRGRKPPKRRDDSRSRGPSRRSRSGPRKRSEPTPPDQIKTLLVRDLPRDASDSELVMELEDLPRLKREAADHVVKVEAAQKHLKDMEEHAESVRLAAEQRVASARDALLAATQAQAEDQTKRRKVIKAKLMRKGDVCSAFVMFETTEDARRALSEIKDGSVRICHQTIGAEMARQNTQG